MALGDGIRRNIAHVDPAERAGAVPLEQLAAGDEPRELVQPGGDGRGEISEAHIHAVLTCS